jgi:hypothetical protein
MTLRMSDSPGLLMVKTEHYATAAINHYRLSHPALIDRSLSGPQGRCGRFGKISCPYCKLPTQPLFNELPGFFLGGKAAGE